MSEFTPGPWAVHSNFALNVVPLEHVLRPVGGSSNPDSEHERYAKLIHRGSDCGDYPQFWRSRLTHAEARANANLIAAATDLYAACKAIVAFHDQVFVHGRPLAIDGKAIDHSVLNEACELAQRAIAKADGGSR